MKSQQQQKIASLSSSNPTTAILPSSAERSGGIKKKTKEQIVEGLVGNQCVRNETFSVRRTKAKGLTDPALSTSNLFKQDLLYPSLPKLDGLVIRTQKKEQSDAPPSNLTANGHLGQMQEIWSLFTVMEENQRNKLLQGIIERCSSRQIDYICGAMNLKASKNALLGTPTVHSNQQHLKITQLSPRQNFSDFGGDVSTLAMGGRKLPEGASSYQEASKERVEKAHIASSAHAAHHTPVIDRDPEIYLKMFQNHELHENVEGELQNASPDVLRRHIDNLTKKKHKFNTVFETIVAVARETNYQKAVYSFFKSVKDALNTKHATLYVTKTPSSKAEEAMVTVLESTWLSPKLELPLKKVFRHHVLEAGESFNVYNVKQSEDFLSSMDERYVESDIECILSIPIITPKTQRLLGVLEFINKCSGPPFFEAEDESLLQLVSSFWILVLNNSQLKDSSGQTFMLQAAFSDVAKSILNNPSDFEGLVVALQKTTAQLLRAEICDFCTLSHQPNGLRSMKPSEADQFIPLSKNLIPCHVAKTGEVINSYAPKTDTRFGAFYADEQVRNVLCVPMKNEHHKLIGVIQLVNKIPKTASFDKEDEELLQEFALMISAVVHQSKVLIDINSELKRARYLNEFFCLVLQAVESIMIAIDRNQNIIYVNQKHAFDLLEDPDQIITLSDVFGECCLIEDVRLAIRQNRSITAVDCYINVNGNESHYNYTIKPCTASGLPYTNEKVFSKLNSSPLDDDNNLSKQGTFLIVLEQQKPVQRQAISLHKSMPFIPTSDIILADGSLSPKWSGLTVGSTSLISYVQINLMSERYEDDIAFKGEQPCTILNSFFDLVSQYALAEEAVIVSCGYNSFNSFFMSSVHEKEDPKSIVHQAIVCALKLQAPIERWLNSHTQSKVLPLDAHITISISTGQATIGLMGRSHQRSLCAYGGPVALSDHLSNMAYNYGTPILIDATTQSMLPEAVTVREVDLTLPPVPTSSHFRTVEKMFEVVGLGELPADRANGIASYENGLYEYRQLNWNSAMIQFKKAMTLFPEDNASKVMYNRCDFIQREGIQLPPSWDGTWPLNER